MRSWLYLLSAMMVFLSALAARATETPYVRGLWLPGDDQPRCAVLLIAPRVVLTAAHCVWDRGERAPVAADALTIRLDGSRPEGVPETASAKRILVTPGYGDAQDPAHELALIELDVAPQGVASGDFPKRAASVPASGASVVVLGYGEGALRRLSMSEVTEVENGLIRLRSQPSPKKDRTPAATRPALSYGNPPPAGGSWTLRQGDSGGPVFTEQGDLVGISVVLQRIGSRPPGAARGFLKVLTLGISERRDDSQRFVSIHSKAAQALFSRAAAEHWDLSPSFRN